MSSWDPGALEFRRDSSIGTLFSIAGSEATVALAAGAPHGVALNSGHPTPFPRINSFVLFPMESGSVVGIVTSMRVDNAGMPRGLHDAGLIDLPFDTRKMTVSLVGTLVRTGDWIPSEESGSGTYCMQRGVLAFPSVGDSVVLPTAEQLASIVQSRSDSSCVRLGIAPLAGRAPVYVDPNRLFGRHLAVLGNTGSGKSCSVAGLIRWSLESASDALVNGVARPNARFIVLDPNGEYSPAFQDMGNRVRHFRVALPGEDMVENPLWVPAWLWNSEEWGVFSQASTKTQKPLLTEALKGLRAGAAAEAQPAVRCRYRMRGFLKAIERRMALTPVEAGKFPEKLGLGNELQVLRQESQDHIDSEQFGAETVSALGEVQDLADSILNTNGFDYNGQRGCNLVPEVQMTQLRDALVSVVATLPVQSPGSGVTSDAPIPFNPLDMSPYLETLASLEPSADVSQYISSLVMRIQLMLNDDRLAAVAIPENGDGLVEWLRDFIGADNAQNGEVAILDLSLVPSEVVHLLVAVISRVVFEALQRYRRSKQEVLPTVLVLEEAHNFVKAGRAEGENPSAAACAQIIERIAREGRKFGLGLVLSSQRPVEISPTVLSQCNTFLLHRLVNDRDQELVRRLVPDALGGILQELPSLPTRMGLLVGWAAEVPTLVEVRALQESQRPRSADPDFWNVWTGAAPRALDWEALAAEWQAVEPVTGETIIEMSDDPELAPVDQPDLDEPPF